MASFTNYGANTVSIVVHEKIGDHHLPFRASGKHLVAADSWIYDNSGLQDDDGMPWIEKSV
ncbi:MAG TPA: hypothetical protein VGP68_16930 [Gemmataceae bacterium]|jgi:hypothetical protein|nr:hypothetical protein [Gemmataceae bacterium]